MPVHFLKTLASVIPTLIGASLLSFFLVRLVPGDPVTNMLGERGGSPQVVAELKAKLGLDQPLVVQYGKFLAQAIRGDLGTSIVSKRSVSEEFWDRFPATIELSIVAMFWSTLIAIPLGLWAAKKKGSFVDISTSSISLVGYSMPIFWWGLVLIIIFSVRLGWFPVSGRIGVEHEVASKTGFLLIDSFLSTDSWASFKSAVSHLFLPAIVLGTVPLAVLSRMTRASFLEVLREDYIRTALAKGLPQNVIDWKHAFRNILIPIVTVFGLLVGALITGAVLTETIFSWPGIGRWIVKSVEARDYPVIQGGILYLAFFIVLINVSVDLAYLAIDPRLRKR
jgi:dipeptide transport system permease protein